MSNRAVLDDIVTRSSLELFAAYGLELIRCAEPPPARVAEELVYAGIIGYTGESMRGSLVLAPTAELLERSYQGTSSARDWTAELANQLLGRIKNQLLGCGVEIYVTTPVLIRGAHLAPVPRVEELQPHRFVAGTSELMVWFDAEITDGVVLQPGQSSIPAEGETFLF